jgi:iron complex outermembrane receptor protein
LHPSSLTLALLISDPCTATEEFNDKNQPPAKTPDTVTVELKAMTVEEEAIQDPNDPYNKSYTVTNSSTATKTDTPIIETPVSVQVVPRTVMDDQKTTRIKDALENVSGVRAQPTLGDRRRKTSS